MVQMASFGTWVDNKSVLQKNVGKIGNKDKGDFYCHLYRIRILFRVFSTILLYKVVRFSSEA